MADVGNTHHLSVPYIRSPPSEIPFFPSGDNIGGFTCAIRLFSPTVHVFLSNPYLDPDCQNHVHLTGKGEAPQ
jgi:hypothetical protein